MEGSTSLSRTHQRGRRRVNVIGSGVECCILMVSVLQREYEPREAGVGVGGADKTEELSDMI